MFQENQFLPFQASALPPGPWLVFAPHPDDETFGMGGALLLGAQQGIEATLVVLTDGCRGGDQKDLVTRRESEARKAAQKFNAKEILFWRQRDRELAITEDLLERTVALIEDRAPESVFVTSPFEPHPDHRTAAALIWQALQRCKPFKGALYAYEVSVQCPVNVLIDITSVVEQKLAVMSVYASQLSQNRYIDVVMALNTARTYTLPQEVTHAEAFYAYDTLDGELAEQVISSLAPYWRRENHAATKPLVSVIIRTKDRPVLLREALQSLATQTYSQLEAVVVNDGGRDVAEVVNAFAGRLITRVRYFNQQPGAGRSAAANVGLQNATGKYCLFLDDDDWLLPDHIGALVNVLERRQDIGMAYAGVRCVQQDDAGEWRQVYIYNEPFDPIRLLHENYIPIHAALFSRDLVEAGYRFDERLELYEDWDFWVQLSRQTAFFHINQISAVYRISAAGGFGVTGDSIRIGKGLEKFFNKWRRLWTVAEVLKIKHSYSEVRQALASVRSRLAEREGEVAQLSEQAVAKEQALAEREGEVAQLSEQAVVKEQALADLHTQLEETRLLLSNREGEIAKLSEERAAKEGELGALRWRLDGVEEELQLVLRSKSLRLTAPLRAAWRGLGRVYGGGRQLLSRTVRGGWRRLPLPVAWKVAGKETFFRALPGVFRHTVAYQAWVAHVSSSRQGPAAAPDSAGFHEAPELGDADSREPPA